MNSYPDYKIIATRFISAFISFIRFSVDQNMHFVFLFYSVEGMLRVILYNSASYVHLLVWTCFFFQFNPPVLFQQSTPTT